MSKAPLRDTGKYITVLQMGLICRWKAAIPAAFQRLPGHTLTDAVSADSHLS